MVLAGLLHRESHHGKQHIRIAEGSVKMNRKPAVVYSSRTGNTRRLAEDLATRYGLSLSSVQDAPAFPDGTPLILGAWTKRGGPDPRMAEYMGRLRSRDVFFFCTMAAYADSPHAAGCLERAKGLLEANGCRLAGHFLCMGRLDPLVLAHSRHPMTPERKARLLEAESHPDEDDMKALAEAVSSAFPYLAHPD